MASRKHHLRTWIATRSAPLMFALALTFLVCQAVLVVAWFDVPNLVGNIETSVDADIATAQELRAVRKISIVGATIFLMLMIWPVVAVESALHWITRPWDAEMRRFHFFGLMFCVCPSLRMCARSPEMHGRLWLPGLGWRQANKRLRERLERLLGVPMIFIALLLMPVLIVDFFMKTQVAQYDWLRILLHISTGVIWFAFAAEFILMVSVAEKKIAYCKKNWIDLAIILLPLVSFLRSLRLLKTMQIAKMARAYRLRGTAVKALRALIVLEFFHRFLRLDVDRKIQKLETQLADLESQAKRIRHKIARLKRERNDEAETLADDTQLVQRQDGRPSFDEAQTRITQ